MPINNQFYLQRLQTLAKFFEKRYLLDLASEEFSALESNDWHALSFFLRGYAFEHQGRSPNFGPVAANVVQDLSEECRLEDSDTAKKVWDKFCNALSKLPSRNEEAGKEPEILAAAKVNPLAPKDFEFYLRRKGVKSQKPNRVKKISVIEFVRPVERRNIVAWTKRELSKDAKAAHNSLKDINGVGGKIASLWLRDIACLFQLEPDLERQKEYRHLLFPVDIWVRRAVAIMAGEKKYNDPKWDSETAKWAVKECIKYDLSPEKVNMGLWYLGAQIAGSEYVMEKNFKDESQFADLVREHLKRMGRAVTSVVSEISSWH